MLKRIKYISRFSHPMTAQDLKEVERVSEANNRERGLTGVLLASAGLFFQVVEGPKESVEALWAALQRDTRHRDLLLLLGAEEGESLTREFPGWHMRAVDLDAKEDARLEPLRAILQVVLRQAQGIYDLTAVLERASRLDYV